MLYKDASARLHSVGDGKLLYKSWPLIAVQCGIWVQLTTTVYFRVHAVLLPFSKYWLYMVFFLLILKKNKSGVSHGIVVTPPTRLAGVDFEPNKLWYVLYLPLWLLYIYSYLLQYLWVHNLECGTRPQRNVNTINCTIIESK